MIGFIDRFTGGAINIDAIERVGPARTVMTPHGGEKRFPVYFKGGDGRSTGVELSDGSLRQLLERPVQLLPAEPKTYLLRLGVEDGKVWVARTMLIAWALCADSFIRPVTPAGIDDGGSEPRDGWFVRAPTGVCYELGPDAARFTSEAHLKDEFLRRMRQESDAEGGAE